MEKKEAMKILKDFHDKSALFSVRTALETLHPEFAESEDERMVNQLHSWMNEFGGAEEYTEKVYQWLKGLIEKQGQTYTKKDVDDAYVEGIASAKNELKKQGKSELKDNKDEKITKEIIETFKNLGDGKIPVDINYADIFTWLEKQGEQKTLGYVHHIDINGNYTKEPIKDIKHPNPYSGVGFECEGHYYGMCARDYGIEIAIDRKLICYISSEGEIRNFSKGNSVQNNEKLQGEQKPTDTLKFKIGDWVVFNNKHQSIYQVEKIEDGYYILRHTHGGTFRVCVLHDESLRLWTIQDAKDGDVLACNEEILLFKSYSVQGRISLYCWYNGQTNNFHSKEVVDTLMTTRNKICPATKEQRDTLMKAMSDAGYTFDFEKKELKKIEFSDVGHEYYSELLKNDKSDNIADYAYQCAYCMSHDWIEENATWDDVQKACRLGAKWQKKHDVSEDWSEKDENTIKVLMNIIRKSEMIDSIIYTDSLKEKLYDWLKSLKDRVYPK